MHTPIQIQFRGLAPSDAVEQNVHKRVERLQRFYPGITACHVTVELPHHHHHQGNHYRVQVDVSVPGGNLVVTCGDGEHQAHEDVYVVLRDAFDAAARRLEDKLRRPRAQRRAGSQAPTTRRSA